MNLTKKILIMLSVASMALLSLAVQAIPVNLANAINSTALEDKLSTLVHLEDLSNDNNGSPVVLVVSFKKNHTGGGMAASLTSIMLAGGTLGLLPVVENKDITVSYEILVNRGSFLSFSYSENFTEAKSFYNLNDSELPKDVEEWLLTTADTFAKELSGSKEFQQLLSEYKMLTE